MSTQRQLFTVLFAILFSATGYSSTPDSLKIIHKKTKKFLKKSAYVLIPAGHLSNMAFISDTDRKWATQSNEAPLFNEVEIKSFIMKKGEVTNKEYLEFIAAQQIKDTASFKKTLPDTMVWRTPLSYNQPYIEYYLRHPAYQSYPVVGVSHRQAEMYCEWLTEKYNNDPDRIFKKVIYRLPTEAEWVYAAKGGNSQAIFPWNGPYIRASNGDIKANIMDCHIEGIYRDTLYEKTVNGEFKEVYLYRVGQYYDMGAAGALNDGADITAPSISYWANDYGLYNMGGNLCEMVAELGITHGGSWRDPGYYMQNHVRQFYDGETSASAKRGFRYVIEVVEY